jgi:hypothetical protein
MSYNSNLWQKEIIDNLIQNIQLTGDGTEKSKTHIILLEYIKQKNINIDLFNNIDNFEELKHELYDLLLKKNV